MDLKSIVMRRYIYIAAAVAAMLGASSCQKKDGSASGKESGFISINVDKLDPSARTKAGVETSTYPVIIRDEEGKDILRYESLADVPEKITLDVGTYSIEAHTKGELEKQMSSPYYKGIETVRILRSVTTNAKVTCTMQNSRISISYTPEFMEAFATWDITIEDGTDIIHFSDKDKNNSKTVYWLFGENVKILTLNFQGYTKTGSKVSQRREFTKDQAIEKYDNDNEHFSGGDSIEFSFEPVESTVGTVGGIDINMNISFAEDTEDQTINVIPTPGPDNPGGDTPGGDTPGGDTPGTGDNGITLNIPQNLTVGDDTDPALGDTYIAATAGIKSIVAKVSSDNDEMVESLTDVAGEYDGVDLINGCDVVENQNLVAFLESLGKTISVPNKGDKEYTFKVGEFFMFLGILQGHHTFTMTVTDMNGNSKVGSFIITIE